MYKSLLLTFIALFCQISSAEGQPQIVKVGAATYRFENRRFADTFKRTLLFGHSISSGLMKFIFGSPYGDGPGTILAENYAEVEPLVNISEGIGVMETGLSKMNRWTYRIQDKDAKAGSNRDLSVMDKAFDKASVLVGIDALYMSTVFDECRDYSDQGVELIINAFVQKSFAAAKVLILGNVPKENWKQVSTLARQVLQNDNESCRQVVNAALKNSCTPERNCYLVDLEQIVNSLNTTGQLILKDGTVIKDDYSVSGAILHRRQVRPDGINMSDQGVQYIVEDILRRLEQNPPRPVGATPVIQP